MNSAQKILAVCDYIVKTGIEDFAACTETEVENHAKFGVPLKEKVLP